MSSAPARRHPMLISISGIDGAGKSTQIEHLHATLSNAGYSVLLLSFWDDVATLKRIREGAGHTLFKGDKGVGTPEAPIHRRDKNVRSPAMTLVRLGLYTLDALSLRRVVYRAMRSRGDIVIFDRYIYDEFANLDLRNPFVRLYLWIILRCVPRPKVSLVLDANPLEAHARKPEYPLDFLYANRQAYLALTDTIPGITVIPALPLAAAKEEVLRSIKPICRPSIQESSNVS